MSIRIPDLRTQANILCDAIKAGLLTQRGQVLNAVARMRGLNGWAHAVSLGKAEPDALQAWEFAPLPAWVYEKAAKPSADFEELSYEERLKVFTLIAEAGFSPVMTAVEEFHRVIAPNATQVLIPQSEIHREDFERKLVPCPHSWCVLTFDTDSGDPFDASDRYCPTLLEGLHEVLERAETNRIETLEHPDAWAPDLSTRLTEQGIDWSDSSWRTKLNKAPE
jgi:hypothetical protein